MSWRHKEDLGAQLVARVHDQMRVADQWLIDVGRGFTYWPSGHAMTISADPPNFHNAYSIFRMHVETDVVKAGGHSQELELVMAREMGHTALSALTYDDQRDVYKYHCSVYAHCDNAEWLAKVLMGTVGLQASRVLAFSAELNKQFGLEPAISSHPLQGKRMHSDPIVTAIDQFIKPYGTQPSRWVGSPEWEDSFQTIRRLAHNVKFDERANLEGDFDWLSDAPIHLSISADRPHESYGHGLNLELHVPWSESPASRGKTAMLLNEMERSEWNWCHDLGSWGVFGEDDDLVFRCFVPNITFCPGALADLTHDMALRARWMNDTAGLQVMGVQRAYAVEVEDENSPYVN